MYDPTKPYKKQILELISQTWETPYVSVRKSEVDVYPLIERKFSLQEIDHTDGIGTKGFYHWRQRSFRNASLDALAMNLNDLILSRAIPYKLQNHIVIPDDDYEAIIEIIKSLTEECKKRDIAITGGETSIHNNTNALDISLTVSGFIRNYKPNAFQQGDVLIGFKSNGLHSNGFTKVREVFKNEYRDDFITPTKIYSDIIASLDPLTNHGMMHITGGSFTKLKQALGNNNNILITNSHKLKPHNIFYELYEKGVSDEEMYSTFNCGIGFIISVSPDDIDKITEEDAEVIGEVIPGNGKVIIKSMFSDKEIVF